MTWEVGTGTDEPTSTDNDDRWFLQDEREFLIRSLADADREHAAGDLSDKDHQVLVVRDRARLSELEDELAALPPDERAHRGRRSTEVAHASQWRRIGIIAACFLIVAGSLILVIHSRHARLPGQASSGSITLSKAKTIEQQLAQAQTLDAKGQDVTALKLYGTVLTEDPDNPEALTQGGWLQWKSGFAADVPTVTLAGRRDVEKAVRVSPSFYLARLYYGLILVDQDHNNAGGIAQFNHFVADDPPSAFLDIVGTLLAEIYTKAGDPVPPALAQAAASTTTTTSIP